MKEYIYYYKSPIGNLRLVADDNSILALDFPQERESIEEEYPQVIMDCVAQLEEYFSGKRKVLI